MSDGRDQSLDVLIGARRRMEEDVRGLRKEVECGAVVYHAPSSRVGDKSALRPLISSSLLV